MFSMHVNVPVGSQSVSGWAVVIKFNTYIKEFVSFSQTAREPVETHLILKYKS